jgi:ribosome-binding protein aMBF1 (putative translation factor)
MKDGQGPGRETHEAAHTSETSDTPETSEAADTSDTSPAAEAARAFEVPGSDPGPGLPVMPGFREMALHRMPDERAARMAEDRTRLVRELTGQRQAAGLSQTEIAARMGTSQSAVARLESGTADVRASTLERYAAALGSQITWQLDRPGEGVSG